MKFIKNLVLFFIFMIGHFLLGQNLDSAKTQKFQHYKYLLNTSVKDYLRNSQKLLDNVQTPYEKTYANYIMGSSMFRSGRYVNAIHYLEKAEKYGKALDSTTLNISYLTLLMYSYRRAGLLAQSNEAWEKAKSLQKKSKNPYKEAEYHYSLAKIYDIDEDYCNAVSERLKYISLVPVEVRKKDTDFMFATYAQLSFEQIKCGSYSQGEESLQKARSYVKDPDNISSATLFEIYLLSSALIEVNNTHIDEAKKLFDKALLKSKENDAIAVTKLILSERLETDIDLHKDQLTFYKEVNEITKLEKDTTKELTKYETLKDKEALSIQSIAKKTWIIIASILSVIIVGTSYTLHHRGKKQKKAFLQIIENLKKEDNKKSNDITLSANNSTQVGIETSQKEIEQEAKIVQRLEQLEKQLFFKSQNMNATQLSVLLEINPRKLSLILKKYRGEDFYNYLNKVRIDYFKKLLVSEPKYQNYKIAVISEEIGYSSHSQFTNSFKAKNGITPSQYLQHLKKSTNK